MPECAKTHSNVKFQKISGKETPGPRYRGLGHPGPPGEGEDPRKRPQVVEVGRGKREEGEEGDGGRGRVGPQAKAWPPELFSWRRRWLSRMLLALFLPRCR